MLVLTRKEQEKIQIGENIRIIVVRIFGDSVRIGIEAPKEVRITRTEAKERIPNTVCPPTAMDADGGKGGCIDAHDKLDSVFEVRPKMQ